MHKSIKLHDMQDDYMQIHMQEDFRDTVKYLPPRWQELVESRHRAPKDEYEVEPD